MTFKTILSAAVLTLAPTLALANGCGWEKRMNASQCADGKVFDSASGTCVDQATS
ncbi:hypothetical protein NHN26_09110 [Rhodovulum tesquicola]|uniref:Chitin binding peritrophin-A-like protein n=1 Tax=Rhodovulum steppense TaxID=540251 RepID=A0A4R1YUI9_9RHOB|nr:MULTISPECIES: hypothetical protein [Rhodovulum]MCO8145381.1 hypothetical protein [Rhodovulum tesquicola]TCM84745.1 hypothetical protein EV216_11061 [Rhodovulum steppense]